MRVVVTGIGVVTPLGNDVTALAEGLLEGRSGASAITVFDPGGLATRIAAQVNTADLPAHPDRKWSFALSATSQALVGQRLEPGEGGLALGIGLDLFSMPDLIEYLREHGIPPERDRETFLQTPSERCVHDICRRHGLTYPPQVHVSACAASTDALGHAFLTIRRGSRRWMLAGGSDSMINPMGLAGFCKIRATTVRNDEPARASRPFDRDRDGFLLGEGAAVLLLEERESALRRGATVWGEIMGYGCSFDAHGISEPHPEGRGAVLAMRRALENAGVGADEIAYVNAHGTSTPKNDPIESAALRQVLGQRASEIGISSTKSMLGHLISASGAVEVASVLACAARGKVHGTLNLEAPDPLCDLDYMSNGPRTLASGRAILKNSFAFGGQNACLVLKGPDV